jgi:hypothetical protein
MNLAKNKIDNPELEKRALVHQAIADKKFKFVDDQIILDEHALGKRVGAGGFGVVHAIIGNKKRVIKLELKKRELKNFMNEIEIQNIAASQEAGLTCPINNHKIETLKIEVKLLGVVQTIEEEFYVLEMPLLEFSLKQMINEFIFFDEVSV